MAEEIFKELENVTNKAQCGSPGAQLINTINTKLKALCEACTTQNKILIDFEKLSYICISYLQMLITNFIKSDSVNPEFYTKLRVIQQIFDVKRISKPFLKFFGAQIMELIQYQTMEYRASYELIKYLNEILAEVKHFAIENNFSLCKLMDYLCICGDFDYQLSLLEFIISVRPKVNEGLAKLMFPDSVKLQDMLSRFDIENFSVNARSLLNEINLMNSTVHSVQANFAFVGDFKLQSPFGKKSPLWIDFNQKSYSISIYCQPFSENDKKNIEILFISKAIVANIKMKRSLQKKEQMVILNLHLKDDIKVNLKSSKKIAQERFIKLCFVKSAEIDNITKNHLPNIFPSLFKGNQSNKLKDDPKYPPLNISSYHTVYTRSNKASNLSSKTLLERELAGDTNKKSSDSFMTAESSPVLKTTTFVGISINSLDKASLTNNLCSMDSRNLSELPEIESDKRIAALQRINAEADHMLQANRKAQTDQVLENLQRVQKNLANVENLGHIEKKSSGIVKTAKPNVARRRVTKKSTLEVISESKEGTPKYVLNDGEHSEIVFRGIPLEETNPIEQQAQTNVEDLRTLKNVEPEALRVLQARIDVEASQESKEREALQKKGGKLSQRAELEFEEQILKNDQSGKQIKILAIDRIFKATASKENASKKLATVESSTQEFFSATSTEMSNDKLGKARKNKSDSDNSLNNFSGKTGKNLFTAREILDNAYICNSPDLQETLANLEEFKVFIGRDEIQSASIESTTSKTYVSSHKSFEECRVVLKAMDLNKVKGKMDEAKTKKKLVEQSKKPVIEHESTERRRKKKWIAMEEDAPQDLEIKGKPRRMRNFEDLPKQIEIAASNLKGIQTPTQEEVPVTAPALASNLKETQETPMQVETATSNWKGIQTPTQEEVPTEETTAEGTMFVFNVEDPSVQQDSNHKLRKSTKPSVDKEMQETMDVNAEQQDSNCKLKKATFVDKDAALIEHETIESNRKSKRLKKSAAPVLEQQPIVKIKRKQWKFDGFVPTPEVLESKAKPRRKSAAKLKAEQLEALEIEARPKCVEQIEVQAAKEKLTTDLKRNQADEALVNRNEATVEVLAESAPMLEELEKSEDELINGNKANKTSKQITESPMEDDEASNQGAAAVMEENKAASLEVVDNPNLSGMALQKTTALKKRGRKSKAQIEKPPAKQEVSKEELTKNILSILPDELSDSRISTNEEAVQLADLDEQNLLGSQKSSTLSLHTIYKLSNKATQELEGNKASYQNPEDFADRLIEPTNQMVEETVASNHNPEGIEAINQTLEDIQGGNQNCEDIAVINENPQCNETNNEEATENEVETNGVTNQRVVNEATKHNETVQSNSVLFDFDISNEEIAAPPQNAPDNETHKYTPRPIAKSIPDDLKSIKSCASSISDMCIDFYLNFARGNTPQRSHSAFGRRPSKAGRRMGRKLYNPDDVSHLDSTKTSRFLEDFDDARSTSAFSRHPSRFDEVSVISKLSTGTRKNKQTLNESRAEVQTSENANENIEDPGTKQIITNESSIRGVCSQATSGSTSTVGRRSTRRRSLKPRRSDFVYEEDFDLLEDKRKTIENRTNDECTTANENIAEFNLIEEIEKQINPPNVEGVCTKKGISEQSRLPLIQDGFDSLCKKSEQTAQKTEAEFGTSNRKLIRKAVEKKSIAHEVEADCFDEKMQKTEEGNKKSQRLTKKKDEKVTKKSQGLAKKEDGGKKKAPRRTASKKKSIAVDDKLAKYFNEEIQLTNEVAVESNYDDDSNINLHELKVLSEKKKAKNRETAESAVSKRKQNGNEDVSKKKAKAAESRKHTENEDEDCFNSDVEEIKSMTVENGAPEFEDDYAQEERTKRRSDLKLDASKAKRAKLNEKLQKPRKNSEFSIGEYFNNMLDVQLSKSRNFAKPIYKKKRRLPSKLYTRESSKYRRSNPVNILQDITIRKGSCNQNADLRLLEEDLKIIRK